MEGSIKFFNKVKGFGFITTEDPSVGDVFVHVTQIGTAKLRDGQKVEFDLQESPKGKQAHNVRVLE